MKKLTQLICVIAALMLAPHAQATPVTQSTAPAGSDSYWYGNGWAWQQLGSVTLASGTETVSALNSTATLVDQGWGGQDGSNGVLLALYDNATIIWSTYVAGATHSLSTQAYAANQAALDGLNAALSTINWISAPAVTLQLLSTPWAYSGWELHVQNASFSVTSDVPEPASIALLGFAIAGLGFARRKQA